MNDLVLEIKNLTIGFSNKNEKRKVVDNLNFSLNRGEVLGIVGESGSGKSVSALSILQLLPSPPAIYYSGEILFYDENQKSTDLLKLSQKNIRKYRGNDIAVIFQEPMSSLNPVFTCGDQVAEAIIQHQKVDRKTAKIRSIELFKKVELPRPEIIFDSFPHQLSGGQKQRVMIAMALSCQPKILIADEPTTALDVTVQKSIIELLLKFKRELEMSIIFITHDLNLISEIADKILVLNQSKTEEYGTKNEVFSNPKSQYTKALLACRPPMSQRLKRLPTVADFISGNSASLLHADNIQQIEDFKQHIKLLENHENYLQVENLTVTYEKRKNWFSNKKSVVKAVDQVSFTLKKGEILGLVGESGCGKTTLGRTILNLQEKNSGEVFFEGKQLKNHSTAESKNFHRKNQIIFQDPYSSLNPRMKIGIAIMEPMKVHGLFGDKNARKAKAIELLEQVGLEASHFDRFPHEFSGGQRQRISIARALATQPQFIVCDESVSALDVSVQAEILNLLLDLRKKFDLSYIFISHDLGVVKFISDRVMVMKDGKIVESSDAESIYNSPQTEYTKTLIEAIPKGIN